MSNVVGPGDTVLVPTTGLFGIGWGEIAEGLGVKVETLDFGRQSPMKFCLKLRFSSFRIPDPPG